MSSAVFAARNGHRGKRPPGRGAGPKRTIRLLWKGHRFNEAEVQVDPGHVGSAVGNGQDTARVDREHSLRRHWVGVRLRRALA